jgi:tetratricopeptide (TPR) repeat protein
MSRKRVALWLAALALAAALPLAGCGKGSPPPPAEGEPGRMGAASGIEDYQEILRKDPNNLQALIGIGNLYSERNQDAKAIESYRKALELDPSNPNVRTDMALCFRRAGDFDRAVEELKKAISVNPRHHQSRYNLGVILLQDKNNLEEGIRAWEGLLENVPDYPYRDQLKSEIARLRSNRKPARQE